MAFARNVAERAPLASREKLIRVPSHHLQIINIGRGSLKDKQIFLSRGAQVLGIDLCENVLDFAQDALLNI